MVPVRPVSVSAVRPTIQLLFFATLAFGFFAAMTFEAGLFFGVKLFFPLFFTPAFLEGEAVWKQTN